jgi:hypothetical protein
MSVSRDDAANLVSRACTYLDEEKWSAFLDLCDPSFCYRVTVRSPEIKREMVWFKEDYTGLEAMFSVIPEHLRRIGTLFRHTAIGSVEAAGEDSAIIRSTFQCTHTATSTKSAAQSRACAYSIEKHAWKHATSVSGRMCRSNTSSDHVYRRWRHLVANVSPNARAARTEVKTT